MYSESGEQELDLPPAVMVDDDLLEDSDSVIFLGMHLDKGLTWEDHIDNICTKSSTSCNIKEEQIPCRKICPPKAAPPPRRQCPPRPSHLSLGSGSSLPRSLPQSPVDRGCTPCNQKNSQPIGQLRPPQPQSPIGQVPPPQFQPPVGQVCPPQCQSPSGQVCPPQFQPPIGQVCPPQFQPPVGQVCPTQCQSPSGQVYPPKFQPPIGQVCPPQFQPPVGQACPPQFQPPIGQVCPPQCQPSNGQVSPPQFQPPIGQVCPPQFQPPIGQVCPPQFQPPNGQVSPPQFQPPIGQVCPPQCKSPSGQVCPPHPPKSQPPIGKERPRRPASGCPPIARLCPPIGKLRPSQPKPPIDPACPPQPQPPISQICPPQCQPPISQVCPPQYQPPISQVCPPQCQPPINQTSPPQCQPPISQVCPPQYQPPISQVCPPQCQPPISQVCPPQYQPPISQVCPPQCQPPISPEYPPQVQPPPIPQVNPCPPPQLPSPTLPTDIVTPVKPKQNECSSCPPITIGTYSPRIVEEVVISSTLSRGQKRNSRRHKMRPVPRPENTEMVEPILMNMLRVITFGLRNMARKRKCFYNDIIDAIEDIKRLLTTESVQAARDLADEYSVFAQDLRSIWEELWEYYRRLLTQISHPTYPIPSLEGLEISPVVSQRSLKTLLIAAVKFSRKAADVCSIDYVGTTHFVDWVDSTLLCDPCAILCSCDQEFFANHYAAADDLIRMWMEQEKLTQLFLEEWSRGFDWDEISTLEEKPDKNLHGKGPRTRNNNHDAGGVENIILKFNEIEDGAYNDSLKFKGHNDAMDKNVAILG